MDILLVEDEPNQHNYIVDWVQNGKGAWYYLESQFAEYNLGIFDWLLPNLSGLELLKKLRKSESYLPVLMLTAKDTMEDKLENWCN